MDSGRFVFSLWRAFAAQCAAQKQSTVQAEACPRFLSRLSAVILNWLWYSSIYEKLFCLLFIGLVGPFYLDLVCFWARDACEKHPGCTLYSGRV